MADANATNVQAASTVTEAKPETVVIGKKVTAKTGNLIMDIAHEVEGYTKTKALNEAEKLAENVETSYFKLGGVLKLINDNSWFEGFATFDDFVFEKYGFQGRKARYLISIYDNLVSKQIPWEKVAHLGWTKLKDLAPVLTQENMDEWVAKAEKLTVMELQALLKAPESATGEKTAKTSDEVVKIGFKLKKDQADIVQQALAKARGELKTDYDTVALESICAGYLGGTVQASAPALDVDGFINKVGFDNLLQRISEMHPEYDFNVTPAQQTA